VAVAEGCVAAHLARTKRGAVCQLKSPNHAKVLHATITTFKEVKLKMYRWSGNLWGVSAGSRGQDRAQFVRGMISIWTNGLRQPTEKELTNKIIENSFSRIPRDVEVATDPMAAWNMLTTSREMKEESVFPNIEERVHILFSSTITGTKRKSSIMGKIEGEVHRWEVAELEGLP